MALRTARCALLATLLAACSSSIGRGSTDAGAQAADASEAGASCDKLASLHESEQTWHELAADGGMSYWYEDENCVVNSPNGGITRVRVKGGVVSIVESTVIARDACEAAVNRYEDTRANTIDHLYDICEALLAQHCDATLLIDERGVIRECSWNDTSGCADACGQGFHLRRWDFGDEP